MDKRVTFLKFKDRNVFYFLYFKNSKNNIVAKKKKFEVEFIIRTN